MKVINSFKQGSDEWFDFRKGKISGTMVGELYSKRGNRKMGFYELIAERVATEPDGQNAMERGSELEPEAREVFEKEYKLKVEEVGVCVNSKYPNIIQSPDGLIKDKNGKYTQAVEIKCLSSPRHLKAYLEEGIPEDFLIQVVQYFIVNEDLEKLYLFFYDPRIPSLKYHTKEITREELGDLPDKFLVFQVEQMKEVDEIVERLAF